LDAVGAADDGVFAEELFSINSRTTDTLRQGGICEFLARSRRAFAACALPGDVDGGDIDEDVPQIEPGGTDGEPVDVGRGEECIELAKDFARFGTRTAWNGLAFSVGDACHKGFKNAAAVDDGGADGKLKIGVDELHGS